MNRFLPTERRAIFAVMVAALLPCTLAIAQSPGYQAPNFSGMARQASHQAQQIPVFPASPLAGGPAATQGDEFVDVQGNSIVMPASYGQPCPGGFGGGYGDPMAVDFGGYGQEQVGPHYFDVSFGTVWLQSEDTFDGAMPFTSVGAGGVTRLLNPETSDGDLDPGWEIAARYDIGPLGVLEVNYMGLYDIGFSDSVSSVAVAPGGVDFQLETPYSDFGVTPIAGVDDGQTHAIDYEADLQSTEISYRRYWVGQNPRVSGTWLLGARYLRFTDDFRFNTVGSVPPELETGTLRWAGENDMVGFQFGGDGWIGLRQGLRVGLKTLAGVYNNRYKFSNSGTFSATPPAAGLVLPTDFTSEIEGNQVAFATEADLSMVADLLPSWSLRGGYRVLYMSSLVTGANNLNQTTLAAGPVSTQGDLLFHGFHGGLEYVW